MEKLWIKHWKIWTWAENMEKTTSRLGQQVLESTLRPQSWAQTGRSLEEGRAGLAYARTASPGSGQKMRPWSVVTKVVRPPKIF